MILYIMLVALGFLIATLLALAFAPAFWRRAERLTTQRIEQSMPMSIAETEADRDQLRASYAIIIRRLEAALSQEKMRSARQLVKISRLQMEIANLNDRTAQLNSQLEAEHNAASVLRRTIATRVPELNRAASDARQLVHVRDSEINSVVNRLRHREEALAIAQRTTEMQQAEIARLRQAMEMSGAQNAGRFKLRPTQWSIHDYRAEYDRLNVELSKLRERLQVAYDREANQVTQLRTELQQLADQIVTAAASLPEGERRRAISDDRAESETRDARGTGADSQEMDAVMRSIDAIIAGESSTSSAAPPARAGTAPPAYTDQAPKRARRSRAAVSPRRLARGAMATASGLAEATRSVVANAISGPMEKGEGEGTAPKPGRVSAAKLLGGAAVQDEGKRHETQAPRAGAEEIGGTKPDTGEPPAAESTEAAAPVSQTPAPDRTSETTATPSRDAASAEDAGKSTGTAVDSPAGEAGAPDDSGGSLYDRFRTAKPVSGKLMDDAAETAPASEPKDEADDATASPAVETETDVPEAAGSGNGTSQGAEESADASEQNKGGADGEDDEADSSASSLLDRLKQVPENQTQ
ncbi:MAG: hypothetical protein ACLFPA_09470 [Dichotomicrobium sp.]